MGWGVGGVTHDMGTGVRHGSRPSGECRKRRSEQSTKKSAFVIGKVSRQARCSRSIHRKVLSGNLKSVSSVLTEKIIISFRLFGNIFGKPSVLIGNRTSKRSDFGNVMCKSSVPSEK